ncbi:hypothetical protein BV898_05130 [Hypsibius exemplaris]|uniref:Uncharacterized protein n=1 Tax=Hypsibius exemplaris TaxID=2072580 RepID=A0A1W0X0N6_HYPEX|nr:hypothetical protein BV898_05130 [Hypsibius exemplaris]
MMAWTPLLGIWLVCYAAQHAMAINSAFRYFDSSAFLPNYARSFSGLSGVPAKGLLLPVPGTTLPATKRMTEEPVHEEEPLHGFHLGSELESRSLSGGGYSDLSPIFNQPVSTLDLLRTAGAAPAQRSLYFNRYSAAQQNYRTAVLRSPNRSAVPSPLNDEIGDYANPFFRPIYARPAAPPPSKQSKSKTSPCSCPCACSGQAVSTAAPPAVTVKISLPLRPVTTSTTSTSTLATLSAIVAQTSTLSPIVSTKNVEQAPLDVFPVSAKLTTVAATTPQTKSSIDELVGEAFNATRSAGEPVDGNDGNGISVSDKKARDEEPSKSAEIKLDELAESKNDEALTTSLPTVTTTTVKPVALVVTTSLAPMSSTEFTVPITTARSVVAIPRDRTPKQVQDQSTVYQNNPYKAVNPAVGMSPNRRFSSLLDLSMRRGGRQHADAAV